MVISASVRITIGTMLRSKEYSERFLTSKEKNSIEDEVDRVTDAVVDRLIASLRNQGFIEGGKELSETEFQSLFRVSVQAYLDETHAKEP
ncbi:MAG: hypothetical protein ABSF83_00750 [Nitrososphaerales archaeon]